jgi:hypothetical protein
MDGDSLTAAALSGSGEGAGSRARPPARPALAPELPSALARPPRRPDPAALRPPASRARPHRPPPPVTRPPRRPAPAPCMAAGELVALGGSGGFLHAWADAGLAASGAPRVNAGAGSAPLALPPLTSRPLVFLEVGQPGRRGSQPRPTPRPPTSSAASSPVAP